MIWMWNTRGREEWPDVLKSGANIVSVELSQGRKDTEVLLKDLDELDKINLKGIIHIDHLIDPNSIDQANEQIKLKNFIKKIKHHHAIYGYFLYDEPDIKRKIDPNKLRLVNQIVKSQDLTKPTIINYFTALTGEMKDYVGTADIEGFDYYVWTGDEGSDYRGSLEEYRRMLKHFVEYSELVENSPTKQWFAFIQTFMWDPKNVQNSKHVHYEPGYEDLLNLIQLMEKKSNKFGGIAYYYWSSENPSVKTLDSVPTLLSNVNRLSTDIRQKAGYFPVVLNCKE